MKKSDKAKDRWCITNREKLLKNSTTAEKTLFGYLPSSMRRRAICQYPIKVRGRIFFADIFIEDWNIVIEVDGGYHNNPMQQMKDEERTLLLKSLNLKVYRISNEDVFNPSKAKAFVKELRKLRMCPNLFKKKNVVKDKSITSRKNNKYSKSKFKKDKERIDAIVSPFMERKGEHEKTYQLIYKTKDKSATMTIYTSTMTIILRINETQRYLYNQTLDDIKDIVSKFQRKDY